MRINRQLSCGVVSPLHDKDERKNTEDENADREKCVIEGKVRGLPYQFAVC